MPGFDQLNVSKEFSKQLISSSPIKFENKLEAAAKKKENEPIKEKAKPSDDDEIEISDEKENSSEASSLEDDDVEEEEEENDKSETAPVKFSLFQSMTILIFFIFGTALARWWIIERINAGYCEVGFFNWTPHHSHFTPTEFRDYFDPEYIRDRGSQILDYIRPDCQSCPAHAKCYKGFKAVCDPGFIKKQNLLGRFLPIRPTCEPDTQKHRRVKAIANKALEILAKRNVDFQCGTHKGNNSIDAGELRNAIYKLTSASIDEEEFHDLWTSALNDIESHDDVTFSTNVAPPTVTSLVEKVTKTYESKSLANIPFGCAVKLSILRRLNQHKFKLTLATVLAIAVVALRNYLRARDIERRLVSECATAVFARLKEQKRLAETDTNGLTVKFLPVPYLLSELLEAQQNHPARRDRVRSAVERVIESNPLVRAKQNNVDGEIMRVWEWVGV